MDDCVFCKIVAGKIPAKKVAENEGAIAFPDLNPCMPVHVAGDPEEHVASTERSRRRKRDGPGVRARRAGGAPERPRQERLAAVINTGPDAHQVVSTSTSRPGRAQDGWPPG